MRTSSPKPWQLTRPEALDSNSYRRDTLNWEMYWLYARAHVELAKIYALNGATGDAETELKRAVDLRPDLQDLTQTLDALQRGDASALQALAAL